MASYAENLKEITDSLEQGIADMFSSEQYKQYLQTMSRFYNYSFNNTILIAMQRPDATLIAGYNAWRKHFKRYVKRGERGIKILAPAPYQQEVEVDKRDPDTHRPVIGTDGTPVKEVREIEVITFKLSTVFDVSQTEGEPLPELGVNELSGDVAQYNDFMNALKQVSPVPMCFENIDGEAKGYFSATDRQIVIQSDMSEVQTVKTALHEITHAMLHDIDQKRKKDVPLEQRKDRNTREVEAESVAYTVCQHYGIDASDYSFAYIASWSSGREMSELKTSLALIRSTAAELITSIDGHRAKTIEPPEQSANTKDRQSRGAER